MTVNAREKQSHRNPQMYKIFSYEVDFCHQYDDSGAVLPLKQSSKWLNECLLVQECISLNEGTKSLRSIARRRNNWFAGRTHVAGYFISHREFHV
jgi:hypothetical protein